MDYGLTKLRINNAICEANHLDEPEWQSIIEGIRDAVNAGPLKSGDRVDLSHYAAKLDDSLSDEGTVKACWQEPTGKWTAAVEDDKNGFAVADSQWFRVLESAST